MTKYEFQLVVAGVDEMTEQLADDLYDAGCDDGTPYSSEGLVGIGFTREARSLEDAIRSAVADVEKAGYRVARVESPDEPIFSRINQQLVEA